MSVASWSSRACRRRRVAAAPAGALVAAPASAQQYLTLPATIGGEAPNASGFLTRNSQAPNAPFFADDSFYQGVHVGSWTLYPLIQSAIKYDSNILNTHSNALRDGVAEFTPSLVASYSNGIHNTLVYGTLDVNSYFHVGAADYTNGRVGFEHVWEARRDLVFAVTADLVRSTDLTNTGSTDLTNAGVVGLPNTGAPIAQGGFYPVESTTLRSSLSALKSMGDVFFKTSLVGFNTVYGGATFANGDVADQAYRDYDEYDLTHRVGYNLDHNAYVFEETVLGLQAFYRSPGSSSKGLRQTIGAGVRQWRTFSGEIFAGYQDRDYNSPTLGLVSQPTVGGSLTWSPLGYLNFTLAEDRTLQTANTISPVDAALSAVRSTDVSLSALYAPAQNWQAGFNFKYEDDTYVNDTQHNHIFYTAFNLSYNLSRNLLLTTTIQNSKVKSNISVNSYVKNTASVGLAYRY